MYMLDSDQEPSYNFTKNLLLLPRILKLIEDMVDDLTSLFTDVSVVNEFVLRAPVPVSRAPSPAQ